MATATARRNKINDSTLLTSADVTDDKTIAAIRAAVHDELMIFAHHMKETVQPGLPVDWWILNGLDWYLKQERKTTEPDQPELDFKEGT